MNVGIIQIHTALANLRNSGISICKNFNMSPEDLRWKFEAQNFRSSGTSSEILAVTLGSILDLKTQLQRDLTKKVQPRSAAVSANVKRARVPAALTKSVNVSAAPRRNVVAQVKQEAVQVAGPSRVVFSGPERDEEAKTKRACECVPRLSELGYY